MGFCAYGSGNGVQNNLITHTCLNCVPRTDHGYKCASFDWDRNPKAMDFLNAPGFVFLSFQNKSVCPLGSWVCPWFCFEPVPPPHTQADHQHWFAHACQLGGCYGTWLFELGAASPWVKHEIPNKYQWICLVRLGSQEFSDGDQVSLFEVVSNTFWVYWIYGPPNVNFTDHYPYFDSMPL